MKPIKLLKNNRLSEAIFSNTRFSGKLFVIRKKFLDSLTARLATSTKKGLNWLIQSCCDRKIININQVRKKTIENKRIAKTHFQARFSSQSFEKRVFRKSVLVLNSNENANAIITNSSLVHKRQKCTLQKKILPIFSEAKNRQKKILPNFF